VASFKFSELHNTVKLGIGAATTVAAIIGIYVGVEAWADEKLESRISAVELATIKKLAEVQARNEIDHDKITQRTRLVEATSGINITDLQLQILEEEVAEREEQGLEPTARQTRQMERLTKVSETYELVQRDATEKLTVTTITTTTTENRE
jgi:hypothetical protein